MEICNFHYIFHAELPSCTFLTAALTGQRTLNSETFLVNLTNYRKWTNLMFKTLL